MPIRARHVLLFGWLAAAAPAFAGTHTVTLYADLGNDPATGCTVTTSAGSFAGAELALDTTVVIDTSGAQVTRVEQRRCGAGVFGPPRLVDAGSWPAGLGNGDGGTAAIETYLPLSSLGGASGLRVGLFSAAEGGGVDAMLAAPGGGPILIELGAVVDIPTLSGAVLLLLAAALGFFGWLAAGRRCSPLLAVLLLLGGSAALFAAVLRDGQTGDWAGQPLRGTDPAWDAPVNADLRSLYAQVEGPAVFLRIDTYLQPDSSGANAAPQVDAGANVLAPINQPPTLTGTVTDDGLPEPPGALTLAWTQVSGEGTATFGSPAAAVTTTRFSAVGTYVLRLTANDGELSASDEVTVFVDMAAENVAPTLDPVPDRTVAPNTTLSLRLTGHDGNPFDALTYSLASGPAGAAVTPEGVFTFTPTPAQLGGHSMTVQVADPGGLSAQAAFQVTVAEGNHPPVLAPLADEVTSTGANWTRTVTASDPDPGDPLAVTLLSGPAGMTLAGQELSWIPAPDQTGAFPVRIQVTDAAGADDEGDFTVSIPLPGAPVAHDDRYEVRRGGTLDVPAPGVLANDAAPGGGALTAARLGDPDKGAVTAFGADGSFTYEAPPAEPPPPPLDVELGADWTVANLINGPLVGDFDGDGGSDTAVFAQHSQILFLRPDGSLLAFHDGLLPAPHGDCTVDAPPGQGVLADVDDDGKVELVTVANCKRDYPDGPRIYGGNGRLIALSYQPPAGAGPGGLAVDWLSPLVAGDHGAAYGALNSVKLTAARLAPSEPPSILWGVERAPHTASCGTLVPGAGDAHCRVVTVHRGSDGAILRRLYDVPANPNGWGFTLISGRSAPIAADLDADGTPEVVYNGTIWDAGGAVRARLDGLPGPHLPIVDAAAADLDGDGTPEILGLSTQWAHTDGYLRAFRADGTLLWHFVVYRSTVQSSLSVADVDRDGSPEALFSVWADLFVVDARGRLKWLRSFVDGSGTATIAHGSQPARYPVYDLDGDGLPEVIVQDGAHDAVFLRGDNGEEQARWHAPGRPHGSLSFSAQAPTVADLDGDGAAEVLFLLNANDGSTPRVITLRGAAPWRAAPRAYHGRGALGADVAEDGTVPPAPPAFWKDPATNRFDQPAPSPYTVDPRLRAQTSFPYRASSAYHESPPATATIDLVPDNRSPVVTSTPPAAVHRASVSPGTPLTYQITAVDPDAGDVLSYQLVLAGCGTPGAASVDAATGLFRYAAWVNEETTCTFGVRLSDGQGGNTYHGFAVTFTAETRTVPNLIGQPETHALTILAAAELTGGRVSRMPSPAPAGEVIAQAPAAGSSALRNSAVDYVVSTGPAPEDRDDDGDGASENEGDCDDTNPAIHPGAVEIPGNGVDENCDGTERNVAELRIEPGAATRATAEELLFTATAVYDDGTAGDVTASAAWSSSAPGVASIDATGRAQALAPGSTAITAGFGGVLGSASLAVRDRNAGDQEAPVAWISSPGGGGAVTNLAQVLGTASDPNLLRWELAVAPAGQDAFTPIAEGTAPVGNGPLGTFDPTLLLNDIYTLRLTVWDTNGNTTSDEVAVQVEGRQKVGPFSLSFTDLAIPVAGIPIEVVRSYDSRDKASGDFGVGWRLGINTFRVSANRVLGTGWQVLKPGLSFGLRPETPHFISLSYPDGRVEQFDLVIEPTASFLVPLSSMRARFVPRPGTRGTLESLENNNLLIVDPQPGAVALLDDSTLQTYDPQLFRYTTPDGTQIEIHRTDGTRRITDTNGNGLTFTAGGISHSTGASITFVRDGEGRINRITDPLGNSQLYAYDTNGDLASHTDGAGHTTRFSHNRRHDLIRIVDPLGRAAARNEYDEQGRLVATFDAEGKRIELTHHLGSRQQVVRDRRGNVTINSFDERGNVIATTDALGRTTTKTYDVAGNVRTITDPLGHTQSYTYDGNGNILTKTDELGNTETFTYNAQNRLLSATDALGNRTTFTYDTRGNRLTETAPASGVTTFTYDAQGNLLTKADPLGNTTSYAYDLLGRKIRETDPLGRFKTFEHDANGNVVKEVRTRTDASGQTIDVTLTTTYDVTGRPVAVRDAAGGTSTSEYDASGRKTAAVNESGQRTELEHDAHGRLIRTTFADGLTEVRTYDAEGNEISRTDRAGRTTRFAYDALNRLVQTIHPDGTSWSQEYDAAGRVVRRTNENGNSTRHIFDAAGHEVETLDPLGNRRTFVYNGRGELLSTTDELGQTTRFEYDSLGRRVRTIFPDGSTSSTGFDPLGREISRTDQNGKTTRLSYDAADRLISTTDPLGNVTAHVYDELGNRISQTDANGHVTSFEYDNLGRLIRTIRPLGMSEQRAYDAQGNLIRLTDFNGRTTTFEHDAMNRLVRKVFPDGSAVSYTYTASGKRATVDDARGRTTFSYDARDRLVSMTEPGGITTAHAYDAVGNRVSATSPAGVVTYGYDPLNRIIRVIDGTGDSTAYTYEANGRLSEAALPNGTRTAYSYDTLDRLVRLATSGATGILSSFDYTLDAAGRRIRIVEDGTRTVDYLYDDAGRLLREQRVDPDLGGSVTTYTYDAVGNRLSKTDASGTVHSTYDANDRLLTSGAAAFTYDANGNTLSKTDADGLTVYTYDFENRLIGARTPTAIAAYEYDDDGIRVGSSVDGVATRYVVDRLLPFAQLIAELDGGGNPLAVYVHGLDLISRQRGAERRFYHTDGLGSTRVLTDAAGAVTDTYTYDAFGLLLAATGDSSNAFLFAGEQFDPETGLYYLRARFVDPATGRFLTVDPFAGDAFEAVTLHRYLYTAADPVNGIDPSGELTLSLGLSTEQQVRILVFAMTYPRAASTLVFVLETIVPVEVTVGLPGASLFGGVGLNVLLSAGARLGNLQRLWDAVGESAQAVGRGFEKWFIRLLRRTGKLADDAGRVSYKDGRPASWSTKGSVRPDGFLDNAVMEVKLSGSALKKYQTQGYVEIGKEGNASGIAFFFLKKPSDDQLRLLANWIDEVGPEVQWTYSYLVP